MSSADVLNGFFGDWPKEFSFEEDLTGLHWQYREFTLCRAFTWIARYENDTYLGCDYLFPETRALTWSR
ncbi:hypothetical protein [Palleronia pelagia]|uniref:Uncharacterized protein n=1 Tax=Palleronia pelagia TaxID=387096 RepID=A0A1H8AEL7_9RHOB|nr:hypothetical protein [Palleronia pelagia]SEM69292.1 hypothetical protein SAMN04488011_101138 [Palleronia pelagia]